MSQYLLGSDARGDLVDIVEASERDFGVLAADRYLALLRQAFQDVAHDPARPGSRDAATLGAGVRLYHIRFSRQRTAPPTVGRPRHFLIYRELPSGLVGIARVLHDSMDLARHPANDFGETQPGSGSS